MDVIVVGYNKDQKQGIGIGKQNNQAFVSVPYEKLRLCIRTVAAKLQVPVVEQEEAIHQRPASWTWMASRFTRRPRNWKPVFPAGASGAGCTVAQMGQS